MARSDDAKDGDEMQLLGGELGESGLRARYSSPGNDWETMEGSISFEG